MLNDMKKVAEKQDIDPEQLRSAAAKLMTRQFIYYDVDKDRKTYLTLINNGPYFDNLFDALNQNFIRDQEVGMVGIIPRNRMTSLRLKKVEALMLLTVRYLYEEALENIAIKKGMAFTNSEKLIAKYQFATGVEERPGLVELRQMLNNFKRMGLIDNMQEIDTKVIDFTIRPAVRLVLNEGWFKTLEQHVGVIEDDDGVEMEETEEGDHA